MTELNLRVNSNGNTKEDLMAQTRRMAKARNDLSDAFAQSDMLHRRNYQTVENAAVRADQDQDRMSEVWAAIEVINAFINDAQLAVCKG